MNSSLPPLGNMNSSTPSWGRTSNTSDRTNRPLSQQQHQQQSSQSATTPRNNSLFGNNNSSNNNNNSNTGNRGSLGPVQTPPFQGSGLQFSSSGTRIDIGNGIGNANGIGIGFGNNSSQRRRTMGGTGAGNGSSMGMGMGSSPAVPTGLFQSSSTSSFGQGQTSNTNMNMNAGVGLGAGAGAGTQSSSSPSLFNFNNNSNGAISVAGNKSLFGTSTASLASSSVPTKTLFGSTPVGVGVGIGISGSGSGIASGNTHIGGMAPTATSSTDAGLGAGVGTSSSSFGLRRRVNAAAGTNAANGNGNIHHRAPPPKRSMMKMTMESHHFKENKENTMNMANINNNATTAATGAVASAGNKTTSFPQVSVPSSKPKSTFIAPQIDYNRWVVLYGFTNSFQLEKIMKKFDLYGTITNKYSTCSAAAGISTSSMTASSSSSNWICIEYESSLQADKAHCQHGSLIDVHTGEIYNHRSSSSNGSGTSSNNDGIGTQSGATSDSNMGPLIVGVMRIDETVAYKLGLKTFLVLGNTGVEHLGGIDSSIGVADNLNMNNSMSMDADAKSRTNTKTGGEEAYPANKRRMTVVDERDVLLSANDFSDRSGVRQRRRAVGSSANARAGGNIMRRDHDYEMTSKPRDNLCGKVLSWFFEWDDSCDATFFE